MKKSKTPNLLVIILFSVFVLKLQAQPKGEFANPILAGFYPDPSICRVDDDYYLVNSTFAYFPGITIFKSKDLVNWNLEGYALNNPGQLNLDSAGVSRGLFAPTIRYNKGKFYITCTLVDKGGNFVVTAKNPAGPWSDPVWIPEINGIDPSLFFDDDDSAYIIYNSVPPDNKELYQGHRTIRMYKFDKTNLKLIGKEIILVNGGVDINKKPVWIEAPHIFKRNNFYYLICAEGGTAYNHSEVVFKSAKAEGPYTPYNQNPILTQRTLDPNREYPITSTGHVDFVETKQGNWWGVFLGCQPYKPYSDDHYNLGRETFLMPVQWIDGWPVMLKEGEVLKHSYHNPLPVDTGFTGIKHGGTFEYTDEFDSDKLNPEWQFLRAPIEKWYSLVNKKGFLEIKLMAETCAGKMNPALLARRQQHNKSSASTAMSFNPNGENEKSGLLVFQSEANYYFLCKSTENNKEVVQLLKPKNSQKAEAEYEILASNNLTKEECLKEVRLKIESDGDTYSFYYGFEPGKWKPLKEKTDARFLSTKTAGGFVGCMYALYATSHGKPVNNSSYFNWFKYYGENEALKK